MQGEVFYDIGEHVYTPNNRYWEIMDRRLFDHNDGSAFSYVLREESSKSVFGPVYWRLLRRERDKPEVLMHHGPRQFEGKPCGKCGSRVRFLTGNCVACTSKRVREKRAGILDNHPQKDGPYPLR